MNELIGTCGEFLDNDGVLRNCRILSIYSEKDEIALINYVDGAGELVQRAMLPLEDFISEDWCRPCAKMRGEKCWGHCVSSIKK